MSSDGSAPYTRRAILGGVGALGVAATLSSCAGADDEPAQLGGNEPDRGLEDSAQAGRLTFRPGVPARAMGRSGRRQVQGADGAPAAELLVPAVQGDAPMRLVVVLHGAGGSATETVKLLAPYAVEHRLLLLAVKSVGVTWDVIARGGYGPDVSNIDRLLERVSSRYPVKGCTAAGFSDGASYALSLGLTNGDVFDSVIAFSPGFEASRKRQGEPRVFVSHGTGDKVLPIERCSRRLVPRLESRGYEVTYVEFEGGHFVPRDISRRAVDWLTG
jgi:predicted esterase